jgi:5-methylcytosine-specific restriction endonuclease McrA
MPYKNKEQGRQRRHEHYLNHRQEIREKHAAYYAQNRDRIRLQANEYASQHRAEACDRTREWNAANPEKRRAAMKRYYDRHPEIKRAQSVKRRAVKRGATIGDLAAIKAVYRRARETVKVNCYLCGKRIPLGQRHVDHIVPLSKGGAHTASNLAIAHARCNDSKGTKLPHEVGILL